MSPRPRQAALTRHNTAVPIARRLRVVVPLVLALTLSACATPSAAWHDPALPGAAATAPPAAPFEGWSYPAKVGQPFGTTVNGLLTFRGNPTRTFYGTG